MREHARMYMPHPTRNTRILDLHYIHTIKMILI